MPECFVRKGVRAPRNATGGSWSKARRRSAPVLLSGRGLLPPTAKLLRFMPAGRACEGLLINKGRGHNSRADKTIKPRTCADDEALPCWACPWHGYEIRHEDRRMRRDRRLKNWLQVRGVVPAPADEQFSWSTWI